MQNFMITLLTCSVTMSALAIFYMAVTPLLAKRYSERGRYYAWLIIVIGLIIPFRPQFDNAIVKFDVPSELTTTITQAGNIAPVTVPNVNTVIPSALPSVTWWTWWQIATAVWLVGMVVFLAHQIIKHFYFVKMVNRWSESITNEKILTLFQSLKSEMGISKRLDLYLCPCIGSPMMIGFLNSRILLPIGDFTQDELCFILKHELIHYRRKDLWYKLLVLIATAVHWFNPFTYLMAKAIDIQCELSCDAEVVDSKDTDTRQYYSEIIIGVVKYQSKLKTALSTNFYGGKKGMKKRIFSIMDLSKKKAGLALLCAIFIFTVGTGMAFATNTKTDLGLMEIIDLKTLEEPMIVGAGSGPTSAYEWSEHKNKSFVISENQQVEVQLMYIESFTQNNSSKSITLIFEGENGETLTQKIIDTDSTKTITFKNAGTYKLSIDNNHNFSINYGFKIKSIDFQLFPKKPNSAVSQNAENVIEMELTQNYDSSDPFINEKLFYVSDNVDTLNLDVSFQMEGESSILEIADNETKQVLWSDIWNGDVDNTIFTISLDDLDKDKEYVVRFTGTKIKHAKIIITSENSLVKERDRPQKPNRG